MISQWLVIITDLEGMFRADVVCKISTVHTSFYDTLMKWLRGWKVR